MSSTQKQWVRSDSIKFQYDENHYNPRFSFDYNERSNFYDCDRNNDKFGTEKEEIYGSKSRRSTYEDTLADVAFQTGEERLLLITLDIVGQVFRLVKSIIPNGDEKPYKIVNTICRNRSSHNSHSHNIFTKKELGTTIPIGHKNRANYIRARFEMVEIGPTHTIHKNKDGKFFRIKKDF